MYQGSGFRSYAAIQQAVLMEYTSDLTVTKNTYLCQMSVLLRQYETGQRRKFVYQIYSTIQQAVWIKYITCLMVL